MTRWHDDHDTRRDAEHDAWNDKLTEIGCQGSRWVCVDIGPPGHLHGGPDCDDAEIECPGCDDCDIEATKEQK